MATNTNLTRELAVKLIKEQNVPCPNCKGAELISRYAYKKRNVAYKCPVCNEIYHPCKLI